MKGYQTVSEENLISAANVGPVLVSDYGVEPPSNFYDRLWMAVAAGKIPCIQVGGRRYFERGDLPRIIQHFNLTKAA